MATEAQTAANQNNAQTSTGPRTAAGKSRVAGNALKFGLVSAKNCVLPEDAEEYSQLSSGLWEDLSPIGPVEQIFATEIIRNTWRLRRCAAVEEHLAAGSDVADPMCHEGSASIQAAVDRARTQATGALNRAMTQLTRLQTERWTRREVLEHNHQDLKLGLGSSQQVIAAKSKLKSADYKQSVIELSASLRHPNVPLAGSQPEMPSAKQTQSIPRGAPCPCGSGAKFKRCCGENAPPVLSTAA
jgi:uncharacterized protein YchJ